MISVGHKFMSFMYEGPDVSSVNSEQDAKTIDGQKKKEALKKARLMKTAMGGSWTDSEEIKHDGEIITERRKFWIPDKMKKGALHQALGVPEGEKIPVEKLQPSSTDTPLLAKRKSLARTFRKISKKK